MTHRHHHSFQVFTLLRLLSPFVLLILLFILTSTHALKAQQIITYADRDSVRIGEVFQISYVISGKLDRLTYPNADAFEGDFFVRGVDRFRTNSGTDSLVYTLQNFKNENLFIPSQEITVRTGETDTTLFTNPVPLFFKSSVTDTVSALRPIRENYLFQTPIWVTVLFVLMALVAGIAAYRFLKNYLSAQSTNGKQNLAFEPTPFTDPLAHLKNCLDELSEKTDFRTHDDADIFYISLGNAIREYLKAVYTFPALEMTSSEILEHLRSHFASPGTIEKTRRVLLEADMVKFAKLEPDDDAVQSAMEAALAFYHSVMKEDKYRIDEMRHEHEQSELERRERFQQEQEVKA